MEVKEFPAQISGGGFGGVTNDTRELTTHQANLWEKSVDTSPSALRKFLCITYTSQSPAQTKKTKPNKTHQSDENRLANYRQRTS